MGRLRKKIRLFSVIMLVVMFCTSQTTLYCLDALRAFASSPESITTPLSFTYAGANLASDNKYYSSSSYLSGGKINVTVPAGKVITKIFHGSQDITPPAAVGRNSYDKLVNDINGTAQNVFSIGNAEGTKGYYAWYRYSPGGSQGRNWYADVPDINGNIVKISCGPDNYGPAKYHAPSNSPDEYISGYPLPLPSLPGCSTTDTEFSNLGALSLGATKDKAFKLGEVVVPDSAVTNVTATNNAQVNDNLAILGIPITGPDQNHLGYPRSKIISGIDVKPNANDAGFYRVSFQQSFATFNSNFESSRDLPAAGAKVIVYYAAFIVDLKGTTYQYNNEVTVQYDTPPNAPNLVVGDISSPSCVEVNAATSISYTFSNTGGTDITTPFQAKVVIDGATFKTFNYASGLAAGASKTETFSKTFAGTSSYNVAIIVDTVTGESNVADNSKSITVTPQLSCAAVPVPEVVTGDFSIEKLTMPYGQSNTMYPVGVSVTGSKNGTACAISQFGFSFEQNGITKSYISTTSIASAQSFSGPPYPGGMGEGNVNVTMKIVTSCGTTKVVGPKSFTVTIAPNNNPPYGSPGWFAYGNTSNYPAINEVVVGNYVDLGVIHNKLAVPEEPYDPEGDGFFPTWDFAGSSDPWIQSLESQYGLYDHDERFHGLKADVLGAHTIKMKLTDTRGAQSSWRTATLNVVKPNPIAACQAPAEIKSNRPVGSSINADKSRSPMGRSIDHSKDVWNNKQATYVNNTSSDITVTVTLNKVVDSTGLESENVSSCDIIVHPDAPPVAKISAPALGIRGESYDVLNQSYSPDGDTITQTLWYVRYDSNNDGSFSDATEPWTAVTGNMSKYVFSPAKVGKYKFKLRVVEDYGAAAEAESGVMDVINQAPEVSFELAGNSPNPDPTPPTVFKASDILKFWTLLATNSNTALSKTPTYNWQNENEALLAGLGKGKERSNMGVNSVWTPYGFGGATAYSTPLNDNGFGKNGVSIYKAMSAADPSMSQPLLIPGIDGQPAGVVPGDTPIETDRMHLYYQLKDMSTGTDLGNKFYALNKSKIGRYKLDIVWDTGHTIGNYKHVWLDGNPYDYVLSYQNIPTNVLADKTVPYYSGSYQTKTVSVKEELSKGSVKFVFADKTIYLLFTKNTPSKQVYDSSKSKVTTYWNYLSMACSFKAQDASLIACFDVPGATGVSTTTIKDTISKNDHLLFFLDSDGYYSTNGYFGNMYTEVDPYGNITNSGSINTAGNNPWVSVTYEAKKSSSGAPVSYSPAQYLTTSCRFNQVAPAGPPYKDSFGNTYFYEEKVCQAPDGGTMKGYTEYNMRAYPELALGIYVAKYDQNFNLVWRARTGGNTLSITAAYTFDWNENINTMIINSLNQTIVSKTMYATQGTMGDIRTTVNNLIDMRTGAVSSWTGPVVTGMDTNMHVDGAGNYAAGRCASNIYNQCTSLSNGSGKVIAGNVGIYTNMTETTNQKSYQEYVGDGLLLSGWMYYSHGTGYSNYPTGPTVYWLDKGPVADALPVTPRYQFGQFVSQTVAGDAELAFNFKTDQVQLDGQTFGYSFRMLDGKNRYALEFDGNYAYLCKYINGARSVLSLSPYYIIDGKSYAVKIRTVGNVINVWLNKVNYFSDMTDASFPVSGHFGAFSDKPFVTFSAMNMKPYQEDDLWGADYAILDDQTGKSELSYDNIVFTDPEHDPMSGSYSWTYVHTPMFIDNGGLSPLSGKSFATGQPNFDRVGKWDITLRAKDDPFPLSAFKYPDMTFDAYRKSSNAFKKSIIVHRRPVAQFNLTLNTDGTVSWTDTSYDPDRYNATTGHIESGYAVSRGIVERKYYYISPDGTISNTKLLKVSDSGTYTIGLQVKDEFGAWSWPETTSLDVGVRPNNPPIATLTYPEGSKDTPTFFPVGTNPMISWSQTDLDPDTTYTAYEVYIGQVATYSGREYETDDKSSGIKTFVTKEEVNSYLATNVYGNADLKFRIKVRVKDETTWSQWSNEAWFGSRRPPSVVLTFPSGTYENPTTVTTLRPTISWNQNDETGRIAYQQVRVWNEYGALVGSADISVPAANRTQASDSWTMNVDVPRASKLKVQVRVMNENSVWSDWSNVGWMNTNSPPSATMVNPSGTQATPTIFSTTKPILTWTQTDPDPDTVFSNFQIQVMNADNSAVVMDSGILAQNTTSSTASWTVPADLPAGQKLQVWVRVFDGYVWSSYSPKTWMYINRAPTGTIAIQPSTVYQNDDVTVTIVPTDPDGDVVNIQVERSMNGGTYQTIYTVSAIPSGTTKAFMMLDVPQSSYTLRLTVTDPM
ncbi:hypothetical protein B5M42_025005, partial [Paenibacillus athensensis]|uniref:CARDB domain-containing protein n=1 Tax=Paenibacillus athensensis TaxID=1967502 RepID=UPI001E47A20D